MASRNFDILFDLIGVLARRRYLAGERGFASLGLNHTEARLLTLLQRQKGEAAQDALSSMLSVDRSNAGRALKSLEQKGFVSRAKDTADARARLVRMTPQGFEAAEKIVKLRAELAQSFFGDLTEEQAGTIAELLDRGMNLQALSRTGEEAE